MCLQYSSCIEAAHLPLALLLAEKIQFGPFPPQGAVLGLVRRPGGGVWSGGAQRWGRKKEGENERSIVFIDPLKKVKEQSELFSFVMMVALGNLWLAVVMQSEKNIEEKDIWNLIFRLEKPR